MANTKKNKNTNLLLLVVGVGLVGWWIAKHTRRGSVIVEPLDEGTFGVQAPQTNQTQLTTNMPAAMPMPVMVVDNATGMNTGAVATAVQQQGTAANGYRRAGDLRNVGPFEVVYEPTQPALNGIVSNTNNKIPHCG